MNSEKPLPRKPLPEYLRHLATLGAHDRLLYRAVSRGPARSFVKDMEGSERKKMESKGATFRWHDVVFYFARIAGEGITANLAYAIVGRAVQSVRQPKMEECGAHLLFETAISKKTYKRLREEKHPHTRPALKAAPTFEKKVEAQYKLMVPLNRASSKKLLRHRVVSDKLYKYAMVPVSEIPLSRAE
jgi:hypothetical protein